MENDILLRDDREYLRVSQRDDGPILEIVKENAMASWRFTPEQLKDFAEKLTAFSAQSQRQKSPSLS